MPDDLTKKGKDRNTINTSQPHEVKYWADKFGVSEEELLQVIKDHDTNDAGEVEAIIAAMRYNKNRNKR